MPTAAGPGVSSQFAFAIPEMSLAGEAMVTAVRPCPALATGPGRVVTMTVTHLNTAVLRLTVEGQTEPIGTTVYHPFYSETAGGWVKAQDLRIGDVLRTASGTARLLATVRQPGEHRVYNLEVETEHVYYVGVARLLVHNGCGAEGGKGGLAREANAPLDAVHRVVTPGRPQFQLRQGESGLSVFDASKVGPDDILPYFREGSEVVTKSVAPIEDLGLTVKPTPGDPKLPPHLQDAHMDIGPGPGMTRNQFKTTIKKLEPDPNGG